MSNQENFNQDSITQTDTASEHEAENGVIAENVAAENQVTENAPETIIFEQTPFPGYSFTLTQYANLVADMPSISGEWLLDEKNLRANEYLGFYLDHYFSGDPFFCPTDYDGKPDPEQLEHSIYDAWLRTKFPLESREHNMVRHVESIIGYNFVNERLLHQAFIRRSYAAEIKTYADNEVLELLGDTVLSTTLYRMMIDQYGSFHELSTNGSLFVCAVKEGEMNRLRSQLTSKDYLSSRAIELGLDKYILFGSNDTNSNMDPKEDMMEAIIGAVAIDSNYDEEAIEIVIESLLDLHLDFDGYDKSMDQFEAVNSWSQKHFGKKPDYFVWKMNEDEIADVPRYANQTNITVYGCLLTLQNPIDGAENLEFYGFGITRSMARSDAAGSAKYFLECNGYWLNLADAGITPKLELAVNQLQELYQKKYIDQPVYSFERDGYEWLCSCSVSDASDEQYGRTKAEAKKKAAFSVLTSLMSKSGIYDPSWASVLDEDYVSYFDELIMFNHDHPKATLTEKYGFILEMTNKYDTFFAARKYKEGTKEYYNEVGVLHRNIGQTLCHTMNLDFDAFYHWKRYELTGISE